MIKLSIIIPFYNNDIDEVLAALSQYAHDEIEILIINDGSQNQIHNNGMNHVIAINIEHRGVAYCRNYGISIAQGEYVLFWDADDVYPELEVVERMLDIAYKNNATIIGGSFSDFIGDKITTEYYGDLSGYTFSEDGWVDYKDYQFDYGFHRFMYKRQFLIDNDIQFPDLTRFQDPPFLTKALHIANKFWAMHDIVYKYRISPTGVNWTNEKITDCISGIEMNMIFAIDNGYYMLYSFSICRLVRLLYYELFDNRECLDSIVLEKLKRLYSHKIDFAFLDINENDFQLFLNLKKAFICEEAPLCTLVIPAYNVEQYIKECLDSVVHQLFSNFKVIIVDDGSTDNTSTICKEYSKDCRQISYIYQQNRGLGAARNTGLALVDTPYVCFLDSDDMIENRYFDNIDAAIRNSSKEVDMIFTLPRCFDSLTNEFYDWMDKDLFEEILENAKEGEFLSIDLNPSLYLLEVNANRKVYRTQFLRDNNFSFPEGVKWEDIRPHIQLLHSAKTCLLLPDTGFWYRTNIFGRVNASARNTSSGRFSLTSAISHSQNGKGLVCGLSIRKISMPLSAQNKMMFSISCHKAL